MGVSEEVALQKLTNVMDRFAGAMTRVVNAYAETRNPERDVHRLATLFCNVTTLFCRLVTLFCRVTILFCMVATLF